MRVLDHDRKLLTVIDAAMDEAARRAGQRWGCGPGRTDCCMGPFPINLLDARRLQQGLRELQRDDPAKAEALIARARSAAEQLRKGFPGDPAGGLLGDEQLDVQEFCDGHQAMPCPALDPESGLCTVYAHRPWTCRTFGPPTRVGEEPLPACRHCFAPCSSEETEALRVEPDPEGLEDALVDQLEREEGVSGDTFVAFALLGLPTAGRTETE